MKILPHVMCFAAVALLGTAIPSAADYHDTVSKSFQVGDGGTLTLKTDRGKLEVASWPRDEVQITIEREIDSGGRYSTEEIVDMMDVSMDSRGNDVDVTVDVPELNNGFSGLLSLLLHGTTGLRLTFSVMVPQSYNLDLSTSGGSITIDDIAGKVVCRTSGGGIKLSHVDGPVNARTSGGSVSLLSSTGDAELRTSGGGITIGETGGTVVANTSGGSITIDRAEGSVQARTSGGSIRVNEVTGAIDASTSGGSVTAYISEQPAADCRLSTSGGGITVYLNPECRFNVDAKSSGGGVRTDMAVTFTGKIDTNHLVATINSGGPQLYLRTSGGGIRLSEK